MGISWTQAAISWEYSTAKQQELGVFWMLEGPADPKRFRKILLYLSQW